MEKFWRGGFKVNFFHIHYIEHGSLALDPALIQKISKRHFFQDIKNSFHGVTQMGLKPHQFCHRSISGPVAPPSMQKLWTPLATIFVEKKFCKKFWCGSRPIPVTPWKEFLISWKKWHFEIFGTSKASRTSGPCIDPRGLRVTKNAYFSLVPLTR